MISIFINRMKCLVSPHSIQEDISRREVIFNVLLLGLLLLTCIATLYMAINAYLKGNSYEGMMPYGLVPIIALLSILYYFSRRNFRNWIVYIFIFTYLALGIYSLIKYGIALPEGLLTCVLIIIISGILISSRAALAMMILVVASLFLISYVQTHFSLNANVNDAFKTIRIGDVIIYSIFFFIIFLVSWLSARDIENSLMRARNSEIALTLEKNTLEIKVAERTKELEQSQLEKLIELQKFAEFGQLSATLIHDIANPITTVAIELDQISSTKHRRAINNARHSISIIESYVDLAKRNLRNQSRTNSFNVYEQIQNVIDYLIPKANKLNIKIILTGKKKIILTGDNIQFNQFVANIVSNAIESYEALTVKTDKKVYIDIGVDFNCIVLNVQDFGVGINPKDQKSIFKSFYTTKKNKGNGLGLSIAKDVVESYFRGTIDIQSSAQGTIVKIMIPEHI